MNDRLLCWICLLTLSAASPMAFATSSIYTVTTTGSGGSCTANSTSDANCTLDAAITAAANGNIVHFSAAVQTQTIFLPTIFPTLNGVTIDASPNGVTLDRNNTGNIIYAESGAIVLSHLTLQHGLGGNAGGAIYNSGADVTVDSCTLVNNSATQSGGAIANAGGSMIIINSTIANNSAQIMAAA